MSEFVVIGYKGKFMAEGVRLQLLKMQREYLIDPADVGKKPGSGVSSKPVQRP